MYIHDIEAMPRNIKNELGACMGCGQEWINGLVSLEDISSSERLVNKIKKAFSKVNLPNYWVVSFEQNNPESVYFVIFETSLNFKQKLAFYKAVFFGGLYSDIPFRSLSQKYGIY